METSHAPENAGRPCSQPIRGLICAAMLMGVGALTFGARAADKAAPREEPVPAAVNIDAHVFRPAKREATDARIAQLKLPKGFRISKFAEGLENARMLAVAEDGTVYVTRRDQNDVLALNDRDGDGKAEQKRTVASNLENVHGIALHEGRVYLCTVNELYAADRKPDGSLGPPRKLIGDLPDGGQHPNKTLAFGPDGMLYLSAGSTCNACDEPNKEAATLLRISPDGKQRTVYAKGLRNTIGFSWHPQSNELWGMDHGIDWLGDELQPEELNHIQEGRDYGWPYVFGKRQINPTMKAKDEKANPEELADKTEPSVLELDAHSAPMAMVFYTGKQFPDEYRNDAFVALRGSWNRKDPSGYKVVRIRFKDGQPVEARDFLSGFLIEDSKAQFARLAGMALANDGSLLVGDDSNGVIYRIRYTGGDSDTRRTSVGD